MYKNYWWESGNPSFLITLLKQQKYYNIPDIENITIGDELLNSFEIEKLKLEVLLFQAGYLTIESYFNDPAFGISEYKLKVPNLEVQISLNRLFLDYLTREYCTTRYRHLSTEGISHTQRNLGRWFTNSHVHHPLIVAVRTSLFYEIRD